MTPAVTVKNAASDNQFKKKLQKRFMDFERKLSENLESENNRFNFYVEIKEDYEKSKENYEKTLWQVLGRQESRNEDEISLKRPYYQVVKFLFK